MTNGKLMLFLMIAMAAVFANASAESLQTTPFYSASNFNLTAFLLWTAGFCLLLPGGWFIGRMMDLNFRCKFMRWTLKKDYRLLKHKFKGSKTLFSRIVNVSNSVIEVNGKHWVLAGDRMYMENNQKVGLNIRQIDKNPSYDDGCPVIYVDDENITPLEFKGDGTDVRPEELGATYSGYLVNQLYKAISAIKNFKTMLTICVLGVCLTVILLYMVFTTVTDIKAEQAWQHSAIVNMTTTGTVTGLPAADIGYKPKVV